jgi:hypothetical protein
MIRTVTLIASLTTVVATTFAEARGVVIVPIFISRPAVKPWQPGDSAKLGPPAQEGCFNKSEMFNPSNGGHVGWQRIRIPGCRDADDKLPAKAAKASVKMTKQPDPKTTASSKP